jgi:O-antigen/teichoic acid export membrane protein
MKSINKISFDNKSILNKFSHGLILNILLRFKGLIYLPLLVNFLSKEEIGTISYLKSMSALLAGIILLNIPDSSNRLILEAKKEDDNVALNTKVNTVNNFSFLLGLVLILIYVLIIIYYDFLDKRFLLILVALVFAAALKKLSSYIFQIFQNTKLLLAVNVFVEYASLITVITVLYFELYNSILIVLYIYCFFIFLSSIFLFYKLYNTFKFEAVIDRALIRKVLKISIFLFPGIYSMLIIQNTDFILIERFIGFEKLGEYSFAYSIAGFVSGISMAITFFWYSSVVYANDEQLSLLVQRVFNYVIPIFLFVILAYFILTKTVIRIISIDYINTNALIQILITGFFLHILNQIFQGIMYAKKKEKYILIDSLMGALFNLILNIIYIPEYGMIFAAFSTSLTYFLIYLYRFIYVYRLVPTLKKSFLLINMIIIFISITYIYYNLWI